MVRRSGAPVTLYNTADPSTVYVEGRDYSKVNDTWIYTNGFDDYHLPPTITVPAGSSLTPNLHVSMDFYAVTAINLAYLLFILVMIKAAVFYHISSTTIEIAY